MANYVVALVKKDKSEKELRALCADQLDVFLQKGNADVNHTCTRVCVQRLIHWINSPGSFRLKAKSLLKSGTDAYHYTLSGVTQMRTGSLLSLVPLEVSSSRSFSSGLLIIGKL